MTAKILASALVVVAFVAGCAFDGQIAVRFEQASPAQVTESFNPEHDSHRIQGMTTRRRQVVRIDCSVTVAYDVKEATGSAVLIQRFVVHLRTRPLPRGVAYAFDCTGPVIVELPPDASGVQAAAAQAALPVTPVSSVPLAFGRRLRPEPGMQFVSVGWPETLPAGDYRVELSFGLLSTRAIREKVVSTASVSCGRSRYVQPILPPVTRMAKVPAFTIEPSAGAIGLKVPRLAPGIAGYAETTRTLSCVR